MPTPSNWSERLREFLKGWDTTHSDDYLGHKPFSNFVWTEEASSWDEFLTWLGELDGTWCFRGQRDATWYLDTSLDRAVKTEVSTPTSNGYWHLDREGEGRELLFRFQQQAHQYIPALPATTDLCSWFALMQHHGVPTRFLDWTKSAYPALYFAFEEDPPTPVAQCGRLTLIGSKRRRVSFCRMRPIWLLEIPAYALNVSIAFSVRRKSRSSSALILRSLTPAWWRSRAFSYASYFIRRRSASLLWA
jgi:hypothetical protein